MTESEWLECTDIEVMLHHLAATVYPTMAWTDRKIQLLIPPCCRTVARLLPSEYAELLDIIEMNADAPVRNGELEAAANRAEKSLWNLDNDSSQIVFAIGYGDLGLACYITARMHAATEFPEGSKAFETACRREHCRQAEIVRDVIGDPFGMLPLDPLQVSPTVVELGQAIYNRKGFETMPALADALERAGCKNAAVLAHCRARTVHVRGCWVLDRILGKT